MLELKCRTIAKVLYALGWASVAILCDLGFLNRGHHSSTILLFLWTMLGFFALGFTFRIVAYATEIWKSIPEKFHKHLWTVLIGAFGLKSTVIIFLGATVARNSVVNLLHMPPKDFPETTHVMTFFASFGIWLLVAAALLFILFASKIVEMFTCCSPAKAHI
jgi:hypothetical protein